MLLVGLIGMYATVTALVRLSYRAVLYPIPRVVPSWTPAGTTILTTTAADGLPVHALLFPSRDGANTRVLVHFHGNGLTAHDLEPLAQRFVVKGLAVVVAEYRGYGISTTGSPSEDGLYRDAEAVLDLLEARGIKRDDVVLWGTSLGTGVAVEMARQGRGSALVLVSPYTSIPALAARIAPIVPMRLVIGDKFDTLSKAPSLHLPTLIIHGDEDEVIPFAMGERVRKAIVGARFVAVPGAHHNDLFDRRGGDTLVDTIVEHARRAR